MKSYSNSPDHTDLMKVLMYVSQSIRSDMQQTGQFMPRYTALTPGGLLSMPGIKLHDETYNIEFSSTFILMCIATGATAGMLAFPSTRLDYKSNRSSCNPRRKPGVTMVGEALSGSTIRRFLPMHSDKSGRFTTFGNPSPCMRELPEGLPFQSLPSRPPTDEERREAGSVLCGMGYHLACIHKPSSPQN